ncbi:hypothetical protein CKF54_04180 [Psittacicella hinzii]|uniref:Uncharacterized protein n=1 Tax=Psittacicella hinzii TaxID=2028575 RepID=A0A3A1Y6A1_9GAMM|nr:hypothetical protein [Psittacicella hinzii]RIY32810.1 hypothetical protein CKF54_04180 [Psittacicella hinzii]
MKKHNLDKIDEQRVKQLVQDYRVDDKEHVVQHQAQVNALVNYYRELIPRVRVFIKNINNEYGDDRVKISEGVYKNLKYGILLNPLSTFASNFVDGDSRLLKLYVDLDEVYSYLYSTRDWANEQIHLDKFVSRHDLALVDKVLEQMYDYLNTVLRNLFNIYSYAVGYYYGTDSDSDAFNYRMLIPESPHILVSPFYRLSGVNFMYFFVIASQHYYSPKKIV